jgi:hypothetical protein
MCLILVDMNRFAPSSGATTTVASLRLRSDTDRVLVGCHDNTLFVYDVQVT